MSVATKERPLLFSAAMIKAILSGRKSQTRRIVKPQPVHRTDVDDPIGITTNGWWWTAPNGCGVHSQPTAEACMAMVGEWHSLCPHGRPGDHLWVRETWALVRPSFDPEAGIIDEVEEWEGPIPKSPPPGWVVWYAADSDDISHHRDDRWVKRWRPSIFMPRWASRITLEISDVRVERLQSISAADAEAEGVEWNRGPTRCGHTNPISAFRSLWEAINGPGSWARNEWVWVITFRRVED